MHGKPILAILFGVLPLVLCDFTQLRGLQHRHQHREEGHQEVHPEQNLTTSEERRQRPPVNASSPALNETRGGALNETDSRMNATSIAANQTRADGARANHTARVNETDKFGCRRGCYRSRGYGYGYGWRNLKEQALPQRNRTRVGNTTAAENETNGEREAPSVTGNEPRGSGTNQSESRPSAITANESRANTTAAGGSRANTTEGESRPSIVTPNESRTNTTAIGGSRANTTAIGGEGHPQSSLREGNQSKGLDPDYRMLTHGSGSWDREGGGGHGGGNVYGSSGAYGGDDGGRGCGGHDGARAHGNVGCSRGMVQGPH